MPSLNCFKYEIPFKYIFILCLNGYDIGFSWGRGTVYTKAWRVDDIKLSELLHATIPSLALILTILIIGTLTRNASPRVLIQRFSFLRVAQWLIIWIQLISYEVISCLIAWILFGVSLFLLTILPLYVEEISGNKHRRHIICILYFSMIFGNWISGIVAFFPNDIFWIATYIISLCLSIATCIANFFLPESPIWLLSKRNHSQAKENLKILRKNSKDDENEFEIINIFLDNEQNKEQLSICSLLRKKLNYGKTFRFALILFAFNGICGKLIIFPSNVDHRIIQFDDSVPLNAEWEFVLRGCLPLLGIITCVYFLNSFGPRLVMLISTGSLALTFMILSIYSFLINNLSFPHFPFVFTSIYIFMSFVGFEIIPFIIMSEIFPFSARRTGAMLCLFVNLFFNLIFQFLINFYLSLVLFLFYTAFLVIYYILIYFLMPREPNPLNSDEIQMRSIKPLNT